MAPDLQLLRVFLTTAHTLSFTRAAEAHGVSQPRLSLLIRRLEEQVGFRLFARAHRRVSLTREGELLRDKAGALLDGARELDDLIWALRRDGRFRLRIGSPRYTLDIPERLAFIEDFSLRYPDIRLDVDSDRTPALIDRLRAGELDLVFATAPFDDRGLETLPFARSKVLLAIPQEDPLATDLRLSLPMLKDRPLAVYPRSIGDGYFDAWYGALLQAGVVAVECHDDHPAALARFAARRRLLSIIHHWDGQRTYVEPEHRMVVRPLQTDDELAIVLQLTRRKGEHSGPKEAFWSAARRRLVEVSDAAREDAGEGAIVGVADHAYADE
jgi:DNA-binding transcriptional LysR family regulator